MHPEIIVEFWAADLCQGSPKFRPMTADDLGRDFVSGEDLSIENLWVLTARGLPKAFHFLLKARRQARHVARYDHADGFQDIVCYIHAYYLFAW